MANFVFNIAKGRVVEYYNRVENNDPAASALIVIPLETTGLETDAVLKDKDDFAAVVAGTTNEATTLGWNRKTLTDADLAVLPAPDDVNDRFDIDIPDLTWTAVSGNAVSKLVICYDSDTGLGTDANLVPLTAHDFVVTPDGSDITAVINAAGFFRAAE